MSIEILPRELLSLRHLKVDDQKKMLKRLGISPDKVDEYFDRFLADPTFIERDCSNGGACQTTSSIFERLPSGEKRPARFIFGNIQNGPSQDDSNKHYFKPIQT